MIEDRYYWAPHSTRRSGTIWSGSLDRGTLPTDLKSPEVEKELRAEKKLIEKALEAKAFEIAKRFTPYSVKNFKFHTRDRAGRHPPNLGDYDVLAFCLEKSIVINIECKDILPPFCLKDAKRLRETIFGVEGKDEGHFRQIRKRQDYLLKNLLVVARILNWPIDPNDLPEIINIYLTRTKYWWTRFPPKNVNTVFLQVQHLNSFIASLDRKA